MSEYYTYGNTLIDGSIASATELKAEFQAIETGLAKLPSVNNIKSGAINFSLDSGEVNAYSATIEQLLLSYYEGLLVHIKVANTNTGPSTLSVNGLPPMPILNKSGNTLLDGDMQAGSVVALFYNGAGFELDSIPHSIVLSSISSKDDAELARSEAEAAQAAAESAQAAAEFAQQEAEEAATADVVGDIDISADTTTHQLPYWLECNGNLYNTATYSQLYDLLGDFPVKLPDLASYPPQNPDSLAYSGTDTYLAVGLQYSPFLELYKRSGDILTKITSPSGGLPTGRGYSISWAGDSHFAVSSAASTPFVHIYKKGAGDSFSKLPNLSPIPPYASASIFSPDGTYLAVSGNGSLTIYKRSGDTFTHLAAAVVGSPQSGAKCAAWSSDGLTLVVTGNTTPYIDIYQRSGDTFTRQSNPSSLPLGQVNAAHFGVGDQYLALALNVSPYVEIYKITSGSFIKQPGPSTLPTGTAYDCKFNDSGTQLAVAHASTPHFTIYERSGDTFAALPPAETITAGNPYCVDYTSSGEHVTFGHAHEPRLTNYKNSSRLPDIDTGDVNTKAYIKTGL